MLTYHKMVEMGHGALPRSRHYLPLTRFIVVASESSVGFWEGKGPEVQVQDSDNEFRLGQYGHISGLNR